MSTENSPIIIIKPIPKRPYFTNTTKGRSDVSIVGLGCSSFSHFFDDGATTTMTPTTVENLQRDDPIVQDWIKTIHYAIVDAGITLLDTAPWYGHGVSETVVGWALDELLLGSTTTTTPHLAVDHTIRRRSDLTINTKVGRYEADPKYQFDFSRNMTLQSAKRSLERLKITYIDVLQLHDPEFAPSLDILLDETIPALMECREQGLCRAIGLTGYPLSVQHQILQASLERFGDNVWDHALTYSHFNLHDQSLWESKLFTKWSDSIPILSAAPLSMGLLTNVGPPAWHPAPQALKDACRTAAEQCHCQNIDIASLAIAYAVHSNNTTTNNRLVIPCTILGMKSIEQVQTMQRIVNRDMTEEERCMIDTLLDPKHGPFANVTCDWDGVEQARMFWESLDYKKPFVQWQE